MDLVMGTRAVLWADSRLDITDEVVKRLNSNLQAPEDPNTPEVGEVPIPASELPKPDKPELIRPVK